jgi:uncharacterized protein YycO
MYQIQQYSIQLGDKVSRLKRGVPFVRHYAVYLGENHYGQHIFAENNAQNGVQVVLADEFFKDAISIKVESTSKTWEQRNKAVMFAKQRIGQQYSLLNYNCEHFANEVTTGTSVSKQVGIGLGIATLLVGGIVIKRKFRNS